MAELKEVRVFESAAELMEAAAQEILKAALQAVSEHGRFTWALSGGSTPRDLYRRLASDPFRARMPWEAIHFFWGDERHVPPDHPESNFRMAREAMLDAVPVPPGNIHRIHAEEPDAERAASGYEDEIRAFFGVASREWPRFDLVLLGLGKDAHTASLFPGSTAVHERERLVVAVIAPGSETRKTFRITLTSTVLNNAARAVFLVSGEDKAPALQAVIEGAREPERYPAQIIEGNRLWMVDRPAARLLARR